MQRYNEHTYSIAHNPHTLFGRTTPKPAQPEHKIDPNFITSYSQGAALVTLYAEAINNVASKYRKDINLRLTQAARAFEHLAEGQMILTDNSPFYQLSQATGFMMDDSAAFPFDEYKAVYAELEAIGQWAHDHIQKYDPTTLPHQQAQLTQPRRQYDGKDNASAALTL